MANVASGRYIQRDMVAWHASYAGIIAVVASHAVAGTECRVVVPVTRTDEACIAPHVARLAIGNSDGGRAGMNRIDRLRHPACRRVRRIGMAITARNERLVVLVVVAVEAEVIRVAGLAVADSQRIDIG